MKKIILIIIYSFFWKNFLKIFIGLKYVNEKTLKNKKQFILIANHNSHMDTMAIMSAIPSRYIHRVHPIAARDFFGGSLFKKILMRYLVKATLILSDRDDTNNDHIDTDGLNAGFLPIEIDTINFSGPVFKKVDNRLMSLELIRNGMTDAVMFDSNGNNILPARILYKKNILALRGSFRPVTKVNIDMFEKSLEIFQKENNVDFKNTEVIFEITLSNLSASGEIDESDFMDRARLLCSLGHTVMISKFKEYYKLVDYFSNYTSEQVGLTIGVNNFVDIFDENYYNDLSGGILEAFGKMFHNNLKVYLYPMKNQETNEIINSNNLILHPRMKEFYKFFKYNGKIVDIFDFESKHLSIFSRDILEKIKKGENGWEEKLPEGISDLITKQKMFGYKKK